jgi:tetratricopeptide (TPR) repeat protein
MTLPNSGSQARLDSWKEIAAYLKREVRTVQRWEANEGLPVHRHLHDAQVTVYANTEELDGWLAKRAPRLDNGEPTVAVRSEPWWVLHKKLLFSSGVVLMLLVFSAALLHNRAAGARLRFRAHDWVLLADFENRTGEPLFDGTLKYELEHELSQSHFVSVVPREGAIDALRLMQKPPDAKIDLAAAREICLRDGGIRALLTGRLEKFGTTFVFSVQIVEPMHGGVLAADQQTARREEIWPAVRKLSDWVRQALSEQLSNIQQTSEPLQPVTTPSLRALQIYTQADAAGRENQWGTSEQLVRQALEYDQEFASGWIWLAWTLRNQGRPLEEYLPLAQKALKFSTRANERERFFIVGSIHQFAGQDDKAVEAYAALARLYPDDFWGRRNLIYVGSRDELPNLMMAYADLRPNDFRMNEEAAVAVAGSGDFVHARRYQDRARALMTPETGKLFPAEETEFELLPVHEAWLKDDARSGLQELSRLGESFHAMDPVRRELFAEHAGLCYLGFGKVKTAEEWFQRIDDEPTAQDLLALAAFVRGDESMCREHVAKFRGHPGSGRKEGYSSGIALARMGPVPAPQEFIEHYTKFLENIFVVHIKGELALAQGQVAEAIHLLQQATDEFRRGGNHSFLISSDGLALALERHAEPLEALRVLEVASQEKLLELAWDAQYGVFWLRIQAHLAQLLRQTGQTDRARKIENQLRRILAYADTDHPIVLQLKHST